MYFSLLIACLLAASAGALLRRRFQKTAATMIAIGALGCVGLAGWQIFGSWTNFGAPVTHRGQAALGYIMAQHVLNDTRNSQGKIALLLPPDAAAGRAALDSFYEAFARVMLPYPLLKVTDVPYEASTKDWRAGNTPLAELETATQSATDAIAYVVYGGLPQGSESLSMTTRQSKALIYVYDPSGAQRWQSQIESGLIELAVIPKANAQIDNGTSTAGSPNEIFDRHFAAMTKKSLK